MILLCGLALLFFGLTLAVHEAPAGVAPLALAVVGESGDHCPDPGHAAGDVHSCAAIHGHTCCSLLASAWRPMIPTLSKWGRVSPVRADEIARDTITPPPKHLVA